MIRAACRGLARAAVTLFLIVTVSFFLTRAVRGSPFESEQGLPPEVRAAKARAFGFDRPILAQWAAYMGRLARLDLGRSTQVEDRTVARILAQSLPHSLLLGGLALLVAIPAAFALGVLAASRRGRLADDLLMGATTVWILVPSFVLGPILLILFAVQWGLFDVWGWGTAKGTVLPVLALAPAYAGALFRMVRQGLVEALDEPFVRAARARGNPDRRILWLHALRPGLKPALGYLGPAAASILTGTLAVEKVFSIPGLGKHFVDAVRTYDCNLLLGTVAVYSVFLLALTALFDALAAWTDPRIRAPAGAAPPEGSP